MVKEYYINSTIQNGFESFLKNAAKLITMQKPSTCLIINCVDYQEHSSIDQLKKHLSFVGITAQLVQVKNSHHIIKSVQQALTQNIQQVIIVMPSDQSESLLTEDFKKLFLSVAQKKKHLLILIPDQKDNTDSLKREEIESYIKVLDFKNYYQTTFLILKEILPQIELEKMFSEFIKQYESLYSGSNSFSDEHPKIVAPQNPKIDFFRKNLAKNKKFLLPVLAISITIFCVSLFSQNIKEYLIQSSLKHKQDPIQTDFVLPSEAILLDRSELLHELNKKLNKTDTIQTIALVGPGGAGKTTLARQFARIQIAPVVWEINAETHESLTEAFEQLAQFLTKTEQERKFLKGIQNIKEENERKKQILTFVKNKLRDHNNWVLIFDNVERFSDIQDYFPHNSHTWGNGKIILTTRDKNIQNNNPINEIMQIDELNQEQKSQLFIKILQFGNLHKIALLEKQQANEFLKQIPPFPLDISVAAYFLKSMNISYKDYLNRLKENDNYFISLQQKVLKDESDYSRTRYGIITLSLRQLIETHEDFKDLLLFISLLDSQNIPRELLELCKNSTIVDNFIYNLKKHSLITHESSPLSQSISTFSIHRSTQEIALSYLKNTSHFQNEKNSSNLISAAFQKYLNQVIETGDFSKMKFLTSHGERFLKHIFLERKILGSIGSELGRIYFYLGNYARARQLFQTSFDRLIPYFQKKSSDIAKVLIYWGDACRSLSDYNESKNHLENGVNIYKVERGENHPETAWALVLLGNVYRELGLFEKARNVIEQGFKIYKSQKEKVPSKLAWASIHLGDIYRSLGEYEKARSLYQESCQLHKQIYGPYHAKTAWAQVYWGIIEEDIGNYYDAKNILEEAIDGYKRNFGSNHIGTAWALVRLGIAYKHLGELEKAYDVLNKSLMIHKKNYGNEHVRTSWVSVYFASVYNDIGEFSKAKELLKKELEIHRKSYGSNHIKISWILSHLANTYKGLRNLKEAEDLLKQVLKNYELHYGKDHIETAEILKNLGEIYLLEKQLEKAEIFLQKALEIFEKCKHPYKFLILEYLSDAYLNKSKQNNISNTLQQSRIFKAQAIKHLALALKSAKNCFPKGSTHITRIENKLKTLN